MKDKMELRPYQQEAKNSVFEQWEKLNKTLVVLPTGCGKTIVFAKVTEECVRRGKRVLILAHRGELLEQASDKILKATGLRCAVEKAEETCLGSWYRITVGSVQSLQREKRLAQFDPDYFGAIIIDEAHHCITDGYQKILQHFPDAKVLGVTATPDRGDMRNLGEYFESLAYVGFSRFGTTGLLNNPDVTVTNAASNGATTSSTKFKDKTPDQILKDINEAILLAWNASENDNAAIPNHIIMPYEQFNYLATTKVTDLAEKTILTFLLENNVAKQNGSDLVIAATKWCKGAGDAGVDRMVVYRNEERFLAMDELVPLTRAMTSSNTNDFCFDTAYAGNLSEVEMFYDQTMLYVDGI